MTDGAKAFKSPQERNQIGELIGQKIKTASVALSVTLEACEEVERSKELYSALLKVGFYESLIAIGVLVSEDYMSDEFRPYLLAGVRRACDIIGKTLLASQSNVGIFACVNNDDKPRLEIAFLYASARSFLLDPQNSSNAVVSVTNTIHMPNLSTDYRMIEISVTDARK